MTLRRSATSCLLGQGAATLLVVQCAWLPGPAHALNAARDERCRRSAPDLAGELDASAEWEVLPSGPVDGRVFASVVWTGSELIVWGGEAGSEQERRADGAAFDPRRGSWRALPDARLRPRSEHVGVWSDDEMLVWGGAGAGASVPDDAGAYAPGGREWRSLPNAPIAPTEFAVAAWTGRELLIWGGSRGGGVVGERAGASYSPRTDRWRRIPRAPLSPRRGAASVWTGCELIVWGGVATSDRSTNDGATYDPRTRRWRTLPPPPFLSRDDGFLQFAQRRPNLVWTGREVILWGYLDDLRAGAAQVAPAAAYDPTTRNWRALPAAPLKFAAEWEGFGGERAVWVPAIGMLVTTGNLDVRGTLTLVLDPTTGEWTEWKPAPDGANYFGELIWTGDGVIAWGHPRGALILRGTTRQA